MSGFYEELCNLLIRPARQTYTDYDLGPPALGCLALRQNFTFASSQNQQIKASFYRQRNPVTSACVVYLHSFNGSRLQPLRYVSDIIKKGFHVCTMDFAGCGNSGGEYVSLGYHERWDALKLLQQLRERWAVREVIIWGRSMGAVTAMKLYSLLNDQQTQGRNTQVRILSLILDSAFISLKRMVIEVGSAYMKIPQLLTKAIFLLVGSSIEQRANFKLQELELAQDVEKIRCPVMLLASKEDSFVNYSHSEEIFARLPLHDHKQIQYIAGEHYEQRGEPTFAGILKFMEQKYKLFSELTPRQLRISYCARQQGSIQKPSRSLRKYEPRKQPQIAQQQQIQRPCSGQKIQIVKASQFICQELFTPTSEKKIASDRQLPSGDGQRQYRTEKKVEGPKIKITFGTNPPPTCDCLRSKSKPNFTGKALQIVSKSKGAQLEFKFQNQNTEDCEYENHCNIITQKLKKRGRAQKEQADYLLNREPSNANQIRYETPFLNTNYPLLTDQAGRNPQKLSMTAQQYKKVQINLAKEVLHLSPGGKKKGKTKVWQSKSMSNLKSQQSANGGNLKTLSRLNLLKMAQKEKPQRLE